MLKKLYSSPLRVYLILITFAFAGVVAGLKLPISLFPNSTRPTIFSKINYGGLNAQSFMNKYGNQVENALRSIDTDELKVSNVFATYKRNSVEYKIEFNWGSTPQEAKREVENQLQGLSGRWPKTSRDSLQVHFWSNVSGFIAVSFFSEKRSLEQLHKILDPLITPHLAKVKEAEDPKLYSPGQKEINIELRPDVIDSLGINPSDVENAYERAITGLRAGSIQIGDNQVPVSSKKVVSNIEDIKNILITLPSGENWPLHRLANVTQKNSSESQQIYKTNGNKSLILFARPKAQANVKEMSEKVLAIAVEALKHAPNDIKYRVLVDPSQFIRSSISNVFKEVALAAGLAVFVLFLFIGNARNTLTAALEIPLSMILAFILMKWSGMNINLISLGGLALSAGMNIDASIVVLENIFRHMEENPHVTSFSEKAELIVKAVKEVALPLFASTISTLVVFAPLAFTSDLTYAILGDLAKAVVFSHGFSAIVATLLVPTIRLHVLKNAKDQKIAVGKSPIERLLKGIEHLYGVILNKLLSKRVLGFSFLFLALSAIVSTSIFILPKLKREIVGLPQTDWIVLVVKTSGNSKIKEMEYMAGKAENRLLSTFGNFISYTFTMVKRPNKGVIMGRLKDKKTMDEVWQKMEEEFTHTPEVSYYVGPWNPAQMPLPDPPHAKVIVSGGSLKDRGNITKDLLNYLEERETFKRLWAEPNYKRTKSLDFVPNNYRFQQSDLSNSPLNAFKMIENLRIRIEGKNLSKFNDQDNEFSVNLNVEGGDQLSLEKISALPVKINGSYAPLKAFFTPQINPVDPIIYKENGRKLFVINGKTKKGKEYKKKKCIKKTVQAVNEYKKIVDQRMNLSSHPVISIEDGQKDLNIALKQLSYAVLISVLLIMITLLMQFGNFVHTLIILSAVAFGPMGVTLSLWAFDSTISLNSILGVILLNGIAVNNSIILVDFITKAKHHHLTVNESIIVSCKKRLRPILITSLTTILGMAPIALGLGDGGKVLRPLGLAVTGGLLFSMTFTLFVVPFLESLYLAKGKTKTDSPQDPIENWNIEPAGLSKNHENPNWERPL